MIKINSYCVRTFSNLNLVLYSCWSAKQFKPNQLCILKEKTLPFKKFMCRTYATKIVKLSDRTVKSKHSTHDIKRLLSLAKPEKWKITGAVCFLLVSSAVTMAVPFCIGKIIDTIYMTDVDKKRENLKYMCSFFVIAFAVGAIANFGRVYLIQTSGQRIIKRLRQETFATILKQEINFFDKNKTGELINRLSSDSAIVGHSITQNISDGLRSIVTVSACISMMVYTSPQLAFVGLCVVPPVALIAISYGRFVRKITRKVQDELASATQITEERISNIRTVRAFTQEANESESYKKKLVDALVLQYQEALAKAIFYGMTGLSGNLVVLAVLYYGGTMMTDSQITVGDLSAFLMYAGYMGISLGGLTAFYSELMRGIGASAKIWTIMDKIPAIPLTGGLIPQSVGKGLIEFRDIHFSYPMRPQAKVFQGLDLVVPAGSVTAVVGGSGSGKSTLAALLLRYYDPQAGGIFLDGMDISTLDPKWVRTRIGLVSQEPILFSCSIRENVLYGATRPVTEKDIIEACREANAYDFIQSFPDKFETMVGQQGLMLSGGQRQRIAIARAILKNPMILVLDEATSALDAESEHSVQAALDWLMRGRTVITIAHRLSTIIRADTIAVFKNGNVAEMGNYTKLMSINNGIFRKLIEKQTLLNDT